jgi:hypothetical protein
MEFVPLAFANSCNLPNVQAKPGSSAQNRFYCYGVIGRLALLAASIELERTVLPAAAEQGAALALTPTLVADPSPAGVAEGRPMSPLPLAGEGRVRVAP